MRAWIGLLCLAGASACQFGQGGGAPGQAGLGEGSDSADGVDDDGTPGGGLDESGQDGIPQTDGSADDDTDDDDDDDDADTMAVDETGDETDSGSSDGPGARCGDNNRDPGEDCDDGDSLDYNGCTNACRVSGSIAWFHTFPGSPADSERLRGVDYDPATQMIYAAGRMQGSADEESFRVKFDQDGTLVTQMLELAPDDQEDTGVAIRSDGTPVVISTDGPLIRFQELDDKLAVVQTAAFGPGGGGTFGWDVVFGADDEPFGVGSWATSGGDGILLRPTPDWSSAQTLTVGTGAFESFRAVTWSPEQSRYYATYNQFSGSGPQWVYEYMDDGTIANTGGFSIDTDGIALRGITSDDSGLFVVGYTSDPDVSHAYAFEFDGELRWHEQWSGAAGLGGFLIEVATDSESNIIVVGSEYEEINGTLENRPAISKLDSTSGAILWSQIVEIEGGPRGTLVGVTVAANNVIIAAGGASEVGTSSDPVLIALNP